MIGWLSDGLAGLHRVFWVYKMEGVHRLAFNLLVDLIRSRRWSWRFKHIGLRIGNAISCHGVFLLNGLLVRML